MTTGRHVLVQLDGLVGARVVAEPAAVVLVPGQAPFANEHGLADDGGFGGRVGGQRQRLGGAGRHTQRNAVVLIGAEVAPAVVEVRRGSAHGDDAVLDVGRTQRAARAGFHAAFAANARRHKPALVLASGWPHLGLRGHQLQAAHGQKHAGSSHAQGEGAPGHARAFSFLLVSHVFSST